MKTILTLLFSAIYVLQVAAQAGAGIVGEVYELEPGHAEKTHLPYATIIVEDQQGYIHGTTANWDGTFYLGNIPAGKYKLRISHVGRETIERDIELEAGTLQTFDAAMETSIMQTTDVVDVIAYYPPNWDHVCKCAIIQRDITCGLPCRLKKFEAKTKGISAWVLTASLVGGYVVKVQSTNRDERDEDNYK